MSYDCNFRPSGAHEKGADEFDPLLEDVHNAGLCAVVRVIGASLIVKIVKTRRCRLRHMLEAVAGILVEHRAGSAVKATELTSVGEQADDIGKDIGRGKYGQASNPEA